MNHLRWGMLVNIPYFLYSFVNQMRKAIQKGHENSLAHHGLIKLLVVRELKILSPSRDLDSLLGDDTLDNSTKEDSHVTKNPPSTSENEEFVGTKSNKDSNNESSLDEYSENSGTKEP